MQTDALLKVSSAQQVTADGNSTNVIDLATVRRIGTGTPVGFALTIRAAGTNTGSLLIQAISSASASLSSPTELAEYALAAAQLVAGTSIFVPIPPGLPTQAFIGLFYDVTGTVDVTFDASLMPNSDFQQWTAYPKGYTIS